MRETQGAGRRDFRHDFRYVDSLQLHLLMSDIRICAEEDVDRKL